MNGDARHTLPALSYWLPPATLAVVIFLISHRAVPQAVPSFAASDKLAHAIVYAGLAWLTARACWRNSLTEGWSGVVWVVVAVSLYGVSDEFHQSFVPSREASVLDWMADTFGACCGVASYLWSEAARRRRPSSASPPA